MPEPRNRDVPGCRRPATTQALRRMPVARLLVPLAVLLVLGGNPLIGAAQQDRSFVWDSVAVIVELRADGSLHVTERDRVDFVGGPFREGYRDIPLARIDRIDQIRVSGVAGERFEAYRFVPPSHFSGAVANTCTYERIGPSMHVAWSFPATTSANRMFQLENDAYGALRVYDDAPAPYQQLGWSGVDRELTKDARVNRASLTFLLPRAVDPDEVVIAGPGRNNPRDHTRDGQRWTWTTTDLGPGEDLGAILEFPRW